MQNLSNYLFSIREVKLKEKQEKYQKIKQNKRLTKSYQIPKFIYF